MARRSAILAVLVVVFSVFVVACSPSAPAAAPTAAPKAAPPTSAPAAPTSAPAVAPTTAPAAAPTAAPAAKVAFPEKGKTISVIVPFAAGGSTDIQARIMASTLEGMFGTPVTVVNKAGAGSQIGLTDLVNSKPDGYTVGYTNLPSSLMTYLDPDRKATYGRDDFQVIALQAVDPSVVAVKADGPYKSLKDLIDAAKAKPAQVKSGTAGVGSSQHVQTVMFEQATGSDMALVHFDGGGPAITALMGGHIDVVMTQVGESLPQVKSGQVKILGVLAEKRSEFLPDVQTLEQQGIKLYADSSRGMSLPKGTPKEIVQIWSESTKKAMETAQFKQKMAEQGIEIRYLDTPQYQTYWKEYEDRIKPLLEELKKG